MTHETLSPSAKAAVYKALAPFSHKTVVTAMEADVSVSTWERLASGKFDTQNQNNLNNAAIRTLQFIDQRLNQEPMLSKEPVLTLFDPNLETIYSLFQLAEKNFFEQKKHSNCLTKIEREFGEQVQVLLELVECKIAEINDTEIDQIRLLWLKALMLYALSKDANLVLKKIGIVGKGTYMLINGGSFLEKIDASFQRVLEIISLHRHQASGMQRELLKKTALIIALNRFAAWFDHLTLQQRKNKKEEIKLKLAEMQFIEIVKEILRDYPSEWKVLRMGIASSCLLEDESSLMGFSLLWIKMFGLSMLFTRTPCAAYKPIQLDDDFAYLWKLSFYKKLKSGQAKPSKRLERVSLKMLIDELEGGDSQKVFQKYII